jgi:hypothetical protein
MAVGVVRRGAVCLAWWLQMGRLHMARCRWPDADGQMLQTTTN